MSTVTFQLRATTDNTLPIIYGIVSVSEGTATIDQYSGLLTYTTPLVISTNEFANVNVSATSNGLTSYFTAQIELVTPNSSPVWLLANDSNSISLEGGTFLQYVMQAFVPGNDVVTYAAVGLPDWLTLDPSGVLYGVAPVVDQNTVYSPFTVTASSVALDDTTDQVFTLEVLLGTSILGFTWTGPADLGTVQDGSLCSLDVGASSIRNNLIRYSVVGGILPLNLVLDKVQGKIFGFVEYHTRDKDYWFEIDAFDGTDHIVRKFHVFVAQSAHGQMAGFQIPLTGAPLKNIWQSDVTSVIDSRVTLATGDLLPGRVMIPEMSLIEGMALGARDLDGINEDVLNNFEDITVSFGPIANSSPVGNTCVVYRTVVDPQAASRFSVTLNNEIYDVASFNNWRTNITDVLGFVNSGSGSGAQLNPIISSGAISSVQVVAPGSDYLYIPEILVNGEPNLASFSGTLKLVSYTIKSSSIGWSVNDVIDIAIGRFNQTAQLVVTLVNSFGQIVQSVISRPGSYLECPDVAYSVITNGSKSVTLQTSFGINSIDVTSSSNSFVQGSVVLSVNGTEELASWQSSWKAAIPMANVIVTSMPQVTSEMTRINTQPLDGNVWNINSIILSVEGKSWQGDTLFDCIFDSDSTRLEEWLEPVETYFDNQTTEIDDNNTIFDAPNPYLGSVYEVWGNTLFDDDATIEDTHRTIFDRSAPQFHSMTRIRRVYTF